MDTPLKAGTRVEVSGMSLSGEIIWYAAKITRWTRNMGTRESLPAGYEPVRFDSDGATLMVHRSGFRVIDNRAGDAR